MYDFNSNQLFRPYFNGNGAFQPTTVIKSFDKTTMLSTLQDSIDNFVDIINYNVGFTVIGCYKRGEINDQSNKYNFGGTESVEVGEIGHHFLHMYQTNYNADEYYLSEFNLSLINER